jgi:hypothetical protein
LRNAVTTEAKTGSLQLVVTFEILERWNGTDWQAITSYERKVFMSLTDKALPYSRGKLKTLNFNNDFENPEFRMPPEGVTLACTHDTYEGTTRERWDLTDWGGGQPEQAATDKLKRLSAKWRATAETKSPSTPQAAPPSVPSVAPAAPAAAARTSTRETAWAKLNKVWAGKPAADLQERWFAAIQEQRKPEAAFTSADWAIVEDTFEIPF